MNANEAEIRALHGRLLAAWNARDAKAFGDQFTEDGEQVGYDGSQVAGAAAITDNIGQIFAHHPTARYLALVRSVRFVTVEVAVLRAEVGMVPPGGDDINPDRNAVQSLVAVAGPDGWRVALFHNTPAQFHGRPEASEALTTELRAALAAAG